MLCVVVVVCLVDFDEVEVYVEVCGYGGEYV